MSLWLNIFAILDVWKLRKLITNNNGDFNSVKIPKIKSFVYLLKGEIKYPFLKTLQQFVCLLPVALESFNDSSYLLV